MEGGDYTGKIQKSFAEGREVGELKERGEFLKKCKLVVARSSRG